MDGMEWNGMEWNGMEWMEWNLTYSENSVEELAAATTQFGSGFG